MNPSPDDRSESREPSPTVAEPTVSANVTAPPSASNRALRNSTAQTPRLNIFKQRELVQQARVLLETPLEALEVLERLAGVTADASSALGKLGPAPTEAMRVSMSPVIGDDGGWSPMNRQSSNGTPDAPASPSGENSATFRKPARPPSVSMVNMAAAVGVIDDPSVAAQALFIRGLCLGNVYRNEDAYTTAEDIILRFPERSEGYYLKGMAVFAMDFPLKDASLMFQKGYELDKVQKGDEKVALIKRRLGAALQAQRLQRFKIDLVKHGAKYDCYEAPYCPRCNTVFVNPTLGWYCPHCQRDELKTGKRELVRVWQPDSDGNAKGCSRCKKAVGGTFASLIASKARHHCRCCGRVVCGGCSKQTSTVDILLFKEPQRVCDLCYTRLTTGARSTSPIPLRALTDDELGVHLGCAPQPTVGRVGTDANGHVADYASPVVRPVKGNSSFYEIDHNDTHRRPTASSSTDSASTSRNSSLSVVGGVLGGAARTSNVHTCVKSAFEQQLWTTAGRGSQPKNNRTNVSAVVHQSTAMIIDDEDSKEAAESMLVMHLLPYQDVYADE